MYLIGFTMHYKLDSPDSFFEQKALVFSSCLSFLPYLFSSDICFERIICFRFIVVIVNSLKMILAPVFLFLILGLFPVSGELRLATSLIVGMPTMTAVVMMANASGLDGDYALGGVFITTISGIITLPAVCWLLQYVL